MRYFTILICILLCSCNDKRAFIASINKSNLETDTVVADYIPDLQESIVIDKFSSVTLYIPAPTAALSNPRRITEEARLKKPGTDSTIGRWTSTPPNESWSRFKIKNNTIDSFCMTDITVQSAAVNVFIRTDRSTQFKQVKLAEKHHQNLSLFSFLSPIQTGRSFELVIHITHRSNPTHSRVMVQPLRKPVLKENKINIWHTTFAGLVLAAAIFLLMFYIKSKDFIFLLALLHIFISAFFALQRNQSPDGMSAILFLELSLSMLGYYSILLLLPFRKLKESWQLYLLVSCIVIISLSPMIFHRFIIWADFAIVACYLPFIFQKEQEPYAFKYSKALSLSLVFFPIVMQPIMSLYQKQPVWVLTAWQFVPLLLIFTCLTLRYADLRARTENNKISDAVTRQKITLEKVLDTVEAERERISRDLHDELGSTLAFLKLKINQSMNDQKEIIQINKIIDQASDSVREISHELMPPYFEEAGLIPLLRERLQIMKSISKIQMNLDINGQPFEFSRKKELMIYRIIMELLQNCIKHSNAEIVNLQLSYDANLLNIICEDDGNGFDQKKSNGIGFRNINTRLTYLDGNLITDTGPKGTTIIVNIPYESGSNIPQS